MAFRKLTSSIWSILSFGVSDWTWLSARWWPTTFSRSFPIGLWNACLSPKPRLTDVESSARHRKCLSNNSMLPTWWGCSTWPNSCWVQSWLKKSNFFYFTSERWLSSLIQMTLVVLRATALSQGSSTRRWVARIRGIESLPLVRSTGSCHACRRKS